MRPLGRLVEGLWRALGIERTAPITAMAVAMMSREVTVRIDKARAELGYEPMVSVDEGMAILDGGRVDVDGPRGAVSA